MEFAQFGAGVLSPQYDRALLFASEKHKKQFRKNGRVPYLSHLIRVSGLTLDYGAPETVAIAALLHDVAEDCGGIPTLKIVRSEFGDEVADLVLETSDSLSEDPTRKAPWRERKERYIERLKTGSLNGALISGCDKLDNVRALTRSLRVFNKFSILKSFKAGRDDEFWYWDSIASVLQNKNLPVGEELSEAIEILGKIWL